MGRHVKVVLALVVAGVLAMLAYRVLAPLFEERQQLSTSDAGAAKGKLVIGVDNWIGYFPLCSSEMRRRMRQSGYALQCVDDNADYPGRMQALEKGELQFAVATVDSYLLNGRAARYPGSIVAVIDESRGGDAILAWSDKAKSLEDLKGKRLKVAYTPASPSEHLLKSMAVHFDIPVLRERKGDWRVESAGSEDALRKLKQHEVEVAVLWEPDVSRALSESNIVKLIGTEDTEKLIVDILLVSREFSARDPEAVKTLLRNYFLTLKQFRSNPQSLIEEAEKHTGLPKDKVEAMLRGVSWKSLTDNARSWFGVRALGSGGADRRHPRGEPGAAGQWGFQRQPSAGRRPLSAHSQPVHRRALCQRRHRSPTGRGRRGSGGFPHPRVHTPQRRPMGGAARGGNPQGTAHHLPERHRQSDPGR